MQIILNGTAAEYESGLTVGELLSRLRIPLAGTAVAVEGEIVPQDRHGQRMLLDGERVEVLRAVGGG